MKKFLITFMLCMGAIAAYGATTCIHTRTAVFMLKKSVNGISSSHNTEDMTWSVTFDYDIVPNNSSYRTLTGRATCNEITTNTDGAAIQKNGSNVYLRASTSDVGTYCWCSMTEPVSSWWVFMQTYADEETCAANCAAACEDGMKNNTGNFRSAGAYLAIW